MAGTLLDHPSELVSYDAPQSGWIIAQEFIGRHRWTCEFRFPCRYDTWLTSEVADVPFLVPIGLCLLSISPEWVTIGFGDLYQVCTFVPIRRFANLVSIVRMLVIEF